MTLVKLCRKTLRTLHVHRSPARLCPRIVTFETLTSDAIVSESVVTQVRLPSSGRLKLDRIASDKAVALYEARLLTLDLKRVENTLHEDGAPTSHLSALSAPFIQ